MALDPSFPPDLAREGTDAANVAPPAGASGIRGWLSGLYKVLTGTLAASRPPLTFVAAAGSPFALTANWQKVVTTTATTKGLRIATLASASTFDIEWVAVAAGAPAPTDTYGEPILGGEDFASGLPIGDVYLKSASSQSAIVRVGS